MNVQTKPVRFESQQPVQDRAIATGANPHSKPAETVVQEFDSDGTRGLSRAEAGRRLDQYGANELKSAPETPWWKRLLEQFENFLVIILLVAIVISVIEWALQDPRETALPYEALVITLIVVLNAILGFVQESRAEKSVRALMALAAPEATVVRDGERQRVPAREIVPGDIVLVEAGDKIPADARIIDDANLHTDEAPLTGESMPVTKNPRPLNADIGLGDRVNMLFAGTVATYGRGRAVVVATGMQTEVGKIAGLLEAAEKEPTPLQQELDRTGKRLTVVMLGICAIVFAAGLFSAKAFTLNVVLSMFLFAVALAVAAIPEALPAIVTIGLSLGVTADGGSPRHRAQASGDRDARRRHGHLLGQDGHAHPQRDDRACDLLRRLGRRGGRQRLYPGRRLHLRGQARCRRRTNSRTASSRR